MRLRNSLGRWLTLAFGVSLIGLFVFIGMHKGVPVLRHDWSMPSTAEGWRAFALSLISGWDEAGIGEARPYPTLFLLGPALASVGLALGSVVAVGAFLTGIATASVFAGMRVARAFSGGRLLGLALGAILIYNPWSYEKLVAGHLTMLLSTAMCALLASELLQKDPRRWVVLLCSFVAAFQIQFALLVIPFSAALHWNKRTIILTCCGSGLSLLPSIIGIVFSQASLATIPYTATWQFANSVPLSGAILLDGYAFRYTGAAHDFFERVMIVVACAALAGLTLCLRDRTLRLRGASLAALSVFLLLYSTGLRGPVSSLYRLSLYVRPTLVFRELFDIIGVVVVTYVIFAAIAAARNKAIALSLAAAAFASCVAWCVAPPSSHWLGATKIPSVNVSEDVPNTRFALTPWAQPLSFKGRGSGTDIDAYMRDNGVTPINTYSESYPSDVALARFERSHDIRMLEALSVSRVYGRPYLASDDSSIRIALPLARVTSFRGEQDVKLRPLPELSLVDLPSDRDTPGSMSSLYLFDGGTGSDDCKNFYPVAAPFATSDSRKAWVAAPFVYTRYPNIATALGGVFTTDPSALLEVPSRRPTRVLAWVRGVLHAANGAVLSQTTSSWRWVALGSAKELLCAGECAIAGWQSVPYVPIPAARNPHIAAVPVTFRRPLPFLLVGTLPAVAATPRMLLYRDRYDRSWTLLGIKGRHVRVNSLFNGFIVSASRIPRTFFIVELTAAGQFLAMIVSLLAVLFLAIWKTRVAGPLVLPPTKSPQ